MYCKMYKYLPTFTFTVTLFNSLLLLNSPQSISACSSRTIPRPRPSTSSSSSMSSSLPLTTNRPIISTSRTTTTTTTTTTTPRPNITFPTYKCPSDYDKYYCLNGATCFSIKIGESLMYNCECAIDFMGPRCEFKELDGSYLPQRPRPILEKASIASGATCALFFVFFICLTLYLRYDHQKLKCIDDDIDILDNNYEQSFNNEEFDCHYCREMDYCCNNYNDACNMDNDMLVTDEKYHQNSNFKKFIETIPPLSFAIKRSTKL